ncbi:MAG: hypothetical protein EOM52_07270 [Clostridia bacterium]|nr:hypothetical protein [Clostridia bacterium]
MMTVMDKANLLTALIAGDLDYYAFGGSVSVEDSKIAQSSGLAVEEGTVPSTFYELMLNSETISDTKIRLAIDYALDKELLCKQSAQGLGTVTGTSLLPGSAYAGSGAVARGYLPEKAKELLSASTYAGEAYHLACTANRAGLAALIQQNLSAVGIKLEIDTVDSATMFAGMSDGTYDMGIASHTPGTVPLWFVESRFTESNNIFHVRDVKTYADRVTEIKTQTDLSVKGERLKALDQHLADERPFIPLWFARALHVQSPTVSGIDYASSSFSNENVWDWVKK